jgi:hypothetical protein
MNLLSSCFVRDTVPGNVNGISQIRLIACEDRPHSRTLVIDKLIQRLNRAEEQGPIIRIFQKSNVAGATEVAWAQNIDGEIVYKCPDNYQRHTTTAIMGNWTPNKAGVIRYNGTETRPILCQLENAYIQKCTVANDREEVYGITETGESMLITFVDGPLSTVQAIETPCPRGAEFDYWLDSAQSHILSSNGEIVRFSIGNQILFETAVSPLQSVLGNFAELMVLIWNGYELLVHEYIEPCALRYRKVMESPVLQMLWDKVLCEDGSIWKVGYNSVEQVDQLNGPVEIRTGTRKAAV